MGAGLTRRVKVQGQVGDQIEMGGGGGSDWERQSDGDESDRRGCRMDNTASERRRDSK